MQALALVGHSRSTATFLAPDKTFSVNTGSFAPGPFSATCPPTDILDNVDSGSTNKHPRCSMKRPSIAATIARTFGALCRRRPPGVDGHFGEEEMAETTLCHKTLWPGMCALFLSVLTACSDNKNSPPPGPGPDGSTAGPDGATSSHPYTI